MELLVGSDCQDGYRRMFGKDNAPAMQVRYTGKLKQFNANIRYHPLSGCLVSMSSSWKDVTKEIQIGCVQHLLGKVFKHPIVDRTNIDMYQSFLRKLSVGGPRVVEDDELLASFLRVKEEYFGGFFDDCNVQWGTSSFRTLGHYRYTTDTITMSTILRGKPQLLDYVMYHEMLHKKHKFISGRKRTTYHSKEFRADEAKFKDAPRLERELQLLARKHRWSLW